MYQDTSFSVYTNGTYHTMGQKALWYHLWKRLSLPLGLLFVAVILSIIRVEALLDPSVIPHVHTASRIIFFLACIIGLLVFITSRIVFKNNTFALTDDALKIRRGVWKKEEFAIPYRQIQNIEIERTIGLRILGLSSLAILTAAEERGSADDDDPENVIPIIDKDLALSLQDELLKRSNTQKVTEVSVSSGT